MENHKETILKDYSAADEERRLYMFLSHRDLRQEFSTIDTVTDFPAGRVPKPSTESGDGRNRIRQLADCCWGWLTLRCGTR